MFNPKRYFVFIDPEEGGLARDEDIKGPWVFDPDHIIDVSKYQQSKNEHTTPADTKNATTLDGEYHFEWVDATNGIVRLTRCR